MVRVTHDRQAAVYPVSSTMDGCRLHIKAVPGWVLLGFDSATASKARRSPADGLWNSSEGDGSDNAVGRLRKRSRDARPAGSYDCYSGGRAVGGDVRAVPGGGAGGRPDR